MRRRQGFALGVAISVLAVVFMLGLAYSTRSTFHLRNTTRTVTSIQAEYLSDAGMRYAAQQVQQQLAQRPNQNGHRSQCNNSFNGNGQGPWTWQPFAVTFHFDTGTLNVTGVKMGPQFLQVTSEGTTSRAKHVETALINFDGGVIQWQDSTL
ncbi:MAG TPA: hypothetical protein VGO93_15220 [Candidatus Xenobia bacterium]|jgi:Tfp pilus assembly protein PilX